MGSVGETPQESGGQPKPGELLPWQWPKSNNGGQTSSPTSAPPSQGGPSEQLISRSTVATAIVAAAPTIVSLFVAFGCDLSADQQLAIPAAVAAVTAVVLAVRSRRGR